MLSNTMFAGCFLVCLPFVYGQADLKNSYTADKMPLQDKALFLADSLYSHPVFFRKLLHIAELAQPFLSGNRDDPKVSFLFNVFLDKLPDILKTQDTAAILNIVADEMSRVNVSDVVGTIQSENLSKTNTRYQNLMAEAISSRFEWLRTFQRILTRNSVSELYPLNDLGIGSRCHDDVISFLDAANGVQWPPRENLNYTSVPWALKMLDAFGKPPSGVLDGVREWAGSKAECQQLHAHLEAGLILGNASLHAPVDFNGQYCKVTFNTSGIPLDTKNADTGSVVLGVCVPDSCSSHDVNVILSTGLVMNMTEYVKSVECLRSDDDEVVHEKPRDTVFDKAFGGCSEASEGLAEEGWRTCFLSAIDLNKDGEISRSEWLTAWSSVGAAVDLTVDISRMLLLLDINTSSTIDLTDLKYLFHFFDDNNDGRVSIHENRINWESLFSLPRQI